MNRFALLILAVLALLISACAEEGEPVELKLAFEEGKTYLLEGDMKFNFKMYMGDETMDMDMDYGGGMSFVVDKVLEDGSAQIDFTMDWGSFSLDIPPEHMSWNSLKGTMPKDKQLKEAAEIFNIFIGTGGSFTMTPSGKVTAGEGWNESMMQAFEGATLSPMMKAQLKSEMDKAIAQQAEADEEAIAEQVFEAIFHFIPDDPEPVGARGSHEVDNMITEIEIDPFISQFKSFEEGRAVFEYKSKFRGTGDKGMIAMAIPMDIPPFDGDVSRLLTFDQNKLEVIGEDRMNVEMEIDSGDMPMMPKGEKMTFELTYRGDWSFKEGKPKKPAKDPEERPDP